MFTSKVFFTHVHATYDVTLAFKNCSLDQIVSVINYDDTFHSSSASLQQVVCLISRSFSSRCNNKLKKLK